MSTDQLPRLHPVDLAPSARRQLLARCTLLALTTSALIATGADASAAPQTTAPAPTGPVEITQSKALNGNVTPGDAAGFPVTISQPGSYKLMGNLTVPDINTTAIVITANDVTLDLNGFTIAGPQSCGYSGTPTCVYGNGDGIFVGTTQGTYSNVAIANGTVRGLGRNGVFDGGGTRPGISVDRVRALDNGSDGFALTGALVVNSLAMRNGQNGFSMMGGNVQSSIAWNNGQWGVYGTSYTTFGGSNFGGNAWGQAQSTLKQTSGNLCNTLLCPTY